MKRLLIMAAAVTLLMAACTKQGNEFIGKWKPINTGMLSPDFVLTIEETDGQFTMTNSERPELPVVLTYVKKDDILSGIVDGTAMTLFYSDSSKHILFKPHTNADAIEFEQLP